MLHKTAPLFPYFLLNACDKLDYVWPVFASLILYSPCPADFGLGHVTSFG